MKCMGQGCAVNRKLPTVVQERELDVGMNESCKGESSWRIEASLSYAMCPVDRVIGCNEEPMAAQARSLSSNNNGEAGGSWRIPSPAGIFAVP